MTIAVNGGKKLRECRCSLKIEEIQYLSNISKIYVHVLHNMCQHTYVDAYRVCAANISNKCPFMQRSKTYMYEIRFGPLFIAKCFRNVLY